MDSHLIFVIDDSINEKQVDHYLVVQWAYNNMGLSNIIEIKDEDIIELTNLGVLEYISEVNNSIIGIGEDDWIIENEIKIKLLTYLTALDKNSLICKIIKLLKYAITNDRNIYFHFH